jgi:hypothetical protein
MEWIVIASLTAKTGHAYTALAGRGLAAKAGVELRSRTEPHVRLVDAGAAGSSQRRKVFRTTRSRRSRSSSREAFMPPATQ